MRIRYNGLDNRTRVATCSRIKFIEDGFQDTDKQVERDERLKGPVLAVHVDRFKGGKRLMIEVPPGYDMVAAELHLLEKGYLDLTDCTVKIETLY